MGHEHVLGKFWGAQVRLAAAKAPDVVLEG